jgi:hypothetical protein
VLRGGGGAVSAAAAGDINTAGEQKRPAAVEPRLEPLGVAVWLRAVHGHCAAQSVGCRTGAAAAAGGGGGGGGDDDDGARGGASTADLLLMVLAIGHELQSSSDATVQSIVPPPPRCNRSYQRFCLTENLCELFGGAGARWHDEPTRAGSAMSTRAQ